MTLPQLLELSNLKLPLTIHWLDDGDAAAPEGRVNEVVDAEGREVIICDSGVYPPHGHVARYLVAAANEAWLLYLERETLRNEVQADDLTLALNQRACIAIGKDPGEALDEACQRVVAERDALRAVEADLLAMADANALMLTQVGRERDVFQRHLSAWAEELRLLRDDRDRIQNDLDALRARMANVTAHADAYAKSMAQYGRDLDALARVAALDAQIAKQAPVIEAAREVIAAERYRPGDDHSMRLRQAIGHIAAALATLETS